jgi:predicted GTPase
MMGIGKIVLAILLGVVVLLAIIGNTEYAASVAAQISQIPTPEIKQTRAVSDSPVQASSDNKSPVTRPPKPQATPGSRVGQDLFFPMPKNFKTDGIGQPLEFTLELNNNGGSPFENGRVEVDGGEYFDGVRVFELPVIPPHRPFSTKILLVPKSSQAEVRDVPRELVYRIHSGDVVIREEKQELHFGIFRNTLLDLIPPGKKIVRILLWGDQAAGKSSFVNQAKHLFEMPKDRLIFSHANVAGGTGACTVDVQHYRLGDSRIELIDVPGQNADSERDPDALRYLLTGERPANWNMSRPGRENAPVLLHDEGKVDVLIYVVSSEKLGSPEELRKDLAAVTRVANDHKVPHLVALTKVDMQDPRLRHDALADSEELKKAREMFIQVTGLAPQKLNHLILYHDSKKSDFNLERQTFSLLHNALVECKRDPDSGFFGDASQWLVAVVVAVAVPVAAYLLLRKRTRAPVPVPVAVPAAAQTLPPPAPVAAQNLPPPPQTAGQVPTSARPPPPTPAQEPLPPAPEAGRYQLPGIPSSSVLLRHSQEEVGESSENTSANTCGNTFGDTAAAALKASGEPGSPAQSSTL